MSNLTGKLNLASLEGTLFTKGKNGQDLFVIDVTKSKLFKSEKGALYLDLIAYENKDKSISDYMVKQSLDKETREREKAEGKQRPIIGNISEMKPQEASAPVVKSSDVFADGEDIDNLPF
jgi:hypothetical protein